MSYPRGQSGDMQSDDRTEATDVQELRQTLGEWATISSQMIDLLHETAGAERSRNWRPHFAQIVGAIEAFGDRCRDASLSFPCSYAAGPDADDLFEDVREQGQRLVQWLPRIIGE